jgi:hypothetical protein
VQTPPQTPPQTSTDRPESGELDLLRILCCVAWSDGEFAPEERALLRTVVQRHFLAGAAADSDVDAVEAMAGAAMGAEALEELAGRLPTEEDRLLALKLAYMMIRVGRRPGDESSINQGEKVAYRRLVEGLGLSETTIREVEWAAERELARHKGLLGFLTTHFGGLGFGSTQERPDGLPAQTI